MDTVSGGIFLASAIAGGSLGWLLRGGYQNSRATAQSSPFNPVERHQTTSAPKLDLATQPQQLQETLLSQAPVAYLEVDDENQLLWSNQLACQILGIPSEETYIPDIPRLLLELVRSYELDQLIQKTRQTQALSTQDWVLHRVSPDPINPTESVSYPLRGHGIPLGKHVGVFLENRQEATTLMEQRNRWISDVAHELKTPLTSIRLVTETLRDRVDPGLTQWFDRLLNEILRLSNLVEDLLNLSRLERSGGTGLTLKPVELPRLLFAAWQSLEPLANIKQLEIAYEGPSDLIVPLDERLMHRVFINLIDNAIKYSPHEGTILLCATLQTDESEDGRSSPYLMVDVIDEGSGFRENDLPHVFNRFYRADPSRARVVAGVDAPLPVPGKTPNRPVGGAGLGLAIVHQIVEAHGGTTQAQNHPETGGGWMTIKLPTRAISLEEAARLKNTSLASRC